MNTQLLVLLASGTSKLSSTSLQSLANMVAVGNIFNTTSLLNVILAQYMENVEVLIISKLSLRDNGRRH